MEKKLFSPKEAFRFAAEQARTQTADLIQDGFTPVNGPEKLFRDLRRANFEILKRRGLIAV